MTELIAIITQGADRRQTGYIELEDGAEQFKWRYWGNEERIEAYLQSINGERKSVVATEDYESGEHIEKVVYDNSYDNRVAQLTRHANYLENLYETWDVKIYEKE